MKKFKTILTSTVFLAISAFALGQSADEIINKYIQSIGGKDKLSKINSLYIESKMEVMGMEFGSKSTTLNGKGFKTEIYFNIQKLRENCRRDVFSSRITSYGNPDDPEDR